MDAEARYSQLCCERDNTLAQLTKAKADLAETKAKAAEYGEYAKPSEYRAMMQLVGDLGRKMVFLQDEMGKANRERKLEMHQGRVDMTNIETLFVMAAYRRLDYELFDSLLKEGLEELPEQHRKGAKEKFDKMLDSQPQEDGK